MSPKIGRWTAHELTFAVNDDWDGYVRFYGTEYRSISTFKRMVQRIKSREITVPVAEDLVGIASTSEPLFDRPEEPFLSDKERAAILWDRCELITSANIAEVRNKDFNVINVPLTTTGYVGIVFLSDLHLGNRYVDMALLKKIAIAILQIPNLYVFIGGDIIDNFVGPKSRIGSNEHIATPEEQLLLFHHFVSLFGKRLIGLGLGNHDDWSKFETGINMIRHDAGLAEIPCLGEQGIINLHLNPDSLDTRTYKIARKHRPNGGWTNPESAPKRFNGNVPGGCDLVVLEHLHQDNIGKFDHQGKIVHYMRTPGWKAYDEHSRELGFPTPVNFGNVLVALFDPYAATPWDGIKIAPSLRDALIAIRGYVAPGAYAGSDLIFDEAPIVDYLPEPVAGARADAV